MSHDIGRRDLLKAVGGGAAVATVASGGGAADHKSQFDTVYDTVSGYVTDPDAAVEAGFEPGGPYVPGMGWHFINQERVVDAAAFGLDRTEPQLFVYVDERFVPQSIAAQYEFDDETGLRLGAVEYAIPNGSGGHTEENPPDLYDDEHDEETSEADGWEIHPKAEHAFLTHSGTAVNHGEAGYWGERLDTTNWVELVPGGTPLDTQLNPGDGFVADLAGGGVFDTRTVVSSSVHPELLTLHVWLPDLIDNPAGPFNHDNPAIVGDGAGHDH